MSGAGADSDLHQGGAALLPPKHRTTAMAPACAPPPKGVPWGWWSSINPTEPAEPVSP